MLSFLAFAWSDLMTPTHFVISAIVSRWFRIACPTVPSANTIGAGGVAVGAAPSTGAAAGESAAVCASPRAQAAMTTPRATTTVEW